MAKRWRGPAGGGMSFGQVTTSTDLSTPCRLHILPFTLLT
jgi:hypothetical protein